MSKDKKRMFEVLDEMNFRDGKNGTSTLGVCNQFVSGNKVKGGAHITMGTPESALLDIMNGRYIPILLLIDRKEYESLSAQSMP